jgi:predicted kinase
MFTKKLFVVMGCFLLMVVKSTTIHAFDVEAVKQEITDLLSQELKGNGADKPILLLIGGYPGAGKTTLINELVKEHDIAVISWNSIRQALLDRGVKGSPYDGEIIEAVNANLFRICLERNVNIVIDANAHSHNVKLFEELLDSENYGDVYQVMKLCLNPPTALLLSRIRAREQKEDIHAGTEADLVRDLNSIRKKINMNDYSLIIKNDENIPFEAELKIINAFLDPYFERRLPMESLSTGS